MEVFIIWEDIDDYPEEGGGLYLAEICANRDKAVEICDKFNREETDPKIDYYIARYKVVE